MPPKTDKSVKSRDKSPSKDKGKGKKPGPAASVSRTSNALPRDRDNPVSVEDLEAKLAMLSAELEKEQAERNYFQLERDKINTFWEITKKELEDRKAELRNKDREMEEMEERHQVEIKVYKQKVKHLLYEHNNNITVLKADAETAIKLLQDEQRVREGELNNDKRGLKLDLNERELAHEELIKNLQLEHDKNITKLRAEFDRNVQDLKQKYDRKMRVLREDLDLRRKTEMHEMEERKNTHINELMKKHEKALAEIKNYYNDITHNNLDLINSLKEQLAEMKNKEAETEKLMTEIAAENKKLSEPLSHALNEVEALRHQLTNYNKDKMSLNNCKARLAAVEANRSKLEWEHELLLQRFNQVQKEREELYAKFESTIYEVQQKAGFKNLVLEKKLDALSRSLESKEAQLREVIAASNLSPSDVSRVNAKIDDVLNAKNTAINELEFEVAKLSKAHGDLLRAVDSKLKDLGIPIEELGFTPLTAAPAAGLTPSLAPAGLVSTPAYALVAPRAPRILLK